MAVGRHDLSERNRRWLRKRQAQEKPGPRRALTAAASPIDLTNKTEARKMRVLRQGWQADAAGYATSIPELSFAYRFLAHASSRMRYFPALVNPEEPDGPPVHVKEVAGVPQGLIDSMQQALQSLGVGRLAIAPLQASLSTNFGVTGEAFLLGITGADDEWTIRSIEEFMIFDDQYKLREVPLDPQGILGWEDLDPATTYAARLWTPHWRYRKMADSPMRALLDVAEELLLLSRDVRATARSRLATSGILKIPEGLRMESMLEDNQDPESEDWFGRFAEAMMAPLADEGVASAVVPIGISGEPESLSQLDHLVLDRPYSAMAMELRAEAIGRIATGLDIPREVLEGMSDPNHWGSWLVSDDTFRHHIEPQVIQQVDSVSVAYLRTWLSTAGWDPYWVNRACIWYDPVDLISKPDPMANAIQLHDRYAISNSALREAGGFAETDQPSALEMELRMLQKTRQFPANMVEAIFHAVDPALQFPPINTSGTIPGIGPSGEVAAEPLPPAAPPPAPPAEDTTGPTPATTGPAAPQTPTAPPSQTGTVPSVFAGARPPDPPAPKATPEQAHLSQRLTDLDTQLRAKVQTAANAHMARLLDRAGAKLRQRLTSRQYRDDTLRARIDGVPNRDVPAVLGEPIVAALGFADNHSLINPDWTELEHQFRSWVNAAQQQAVRLARRLAGLPPEAPAVAAAATKLADRTSPAWNALEQALNARAEQLLYTPDLDTPPVYDPDTIVPPGMIRQALAIAGGNTTITTIDVSTPGRTMVDDPAAAMISVPLPQVATGDIVTGMLTDANMTPEVYVWVHGPSENPFEPHLDLDGESFSDFTDDRLQNPVDWPPVEYLFPGDHNGCFPAGTVVEGPSAASATLRYWEGEMVRVGFASGQFLTGTPNHPVLTGDGWVPLGGLDEGDDVVRCLDSEGITRLVPNSYQMPARIEDVAGTVGVSGGVVARSVEVAAEDFHGDGAGSQVAVVRTDSGLRDRLDATLRQPSGQPTLPGPDPQVGDALPAESRSAPGGHRRRSTPDSVVGGDSTGTKELGGRLGHEQPGRGLRSSPFDTGGEQSFTDGAPVDAVRLGQGVLGLTGLVSADKVVHVERYPFAGHVYNLDTRVGWYIADGILVHNCSCDVVTQWALNGQPTGPNTDEDTDSPSVDEGDSGYRL